MCSSTYAVYHQRESGRRNSSATGSGEGDFENIVRKPSIKCIGQPELEAVGRHSL